MCILVPRKTCCFVAMSKAIKKVAVVPNARTGLSTESLVKIIVRRSTTGSLLREMNS